MKVAKYDIRFDTFVRRGVKSKDGPWGVYMVSGFQGSGKTYYSVYAVYSFIQTHKNYKIYTNINSLNIPNANIIYFTKIDEIYSNIEKNCIFIIDEVSNKYGKNSPTDKPLYRFLQQSRKRGRIVFLISQEWKEIPTWLRRPVRFLYITRKLPIFPIFITNMGDGQNLTFNVELNDWECPILMRIIYKRNKKIAQMYDTFEPINEL